MPAEEISVRVSVEGFGEFQSQFKKMDSMVDDSAKSYEDMGRKSKLSLTDLKSGLDLAIGTMKTFAQAAKAAFDFAQEGAQILQARESVKMLGIDMEALQRAAGGTVDDMSLIASAAKLLAGTTGELNTRMAEAAPRLLEIARAAVKLDPTIGSVAFVYESLAKGIKKNQPLLIDNANIVVKVSTAQEQLAASLGKSVAQLTDEEKAVALLEATLEGGANMIEQMGGSIESATDSYAVLTAEIKNMTDSLKAQVAEAVGPSVSKFSQLLISTNDVRAEYGYLQGTMAGFFEMLGLGNTLIDKHNERLELNAVAAQRATEQAAYYLEQQQLVNQENTTTQVVLDDATAAFLEYEDQLQNTEAAVGLYTLQQQAANEAAVQAQVAFNNAAAGLDELTRASFAREQIALLKQALDEGKISSEDYATAQEAILTQFGLLTDAEKRAQGTINTITQAFMDGKLEPEEYARLLDDVKRALDNIDGTVLDIAWNVQTPPAFLPGGTPNTGAEAINVPYQHGGTAWGRSMLVGERGPEMLTGVPGGARVLSNPTTARMMAQGNTYQNNYNLTTNSLVRPGGLALEFAAMEMGSR